VLVLDVNVVLAVHRDDHPHHVALRPWFEDLLEGGAPFSVPTVVWGSFLRLTTSRRAFPVPTPLAEAFAFVEATRSHHRYIQLDPGSQHLALLRRLCQEANATGDLVPDAAIAAIALEHGGVVASMDRDFARFPSIEHIVPGRS